MLRIPFFRFGAECPGLGLISGPLIFDTGEADRSFLYRCQDRFFSYNALSGLRSVVLVTGWSHCQRYRALWMRQRNLFERLADRTRLAVPSIEDPLYVPLDWDTLTVEPQPWFHDQDLPSSGGIALNQVSPTAAKIVQGLNLLLPGGLMNIGELHRMAAIGALALQYHDKAEQFELCRGASGLPPHAETAVLSRHELLELKDWDAVRARFPGRPLDEAYLKSSYDSGGNFAARISKACHKEQLQDMQRRARYEAEADAADETDCASLAADLSLSLSFVCPEPGIQIPELLRKQKTRRGRTRFLLQKALSPPVRGAGSRCIGICCEASTGPLFASGQIYRDAVRKHFLGAYLNSAFSASVLDSSLTEQMKALCSLFAAKGYRGPIGFDACAGPDGSWTLVYDCNPRLSAVYPALAVERFLWSQNLECRHLISLGYRGEWNRQSFEEWLDLFESKSLLYGAGRDRGILMLPNMSRPQGCDLLLVNVAPEESADFLNRAGLSGAAFQLVW